MTIERRPARHSTACRRAGRARDRPAPTRACGGRRREGGADGLGAATTGVAGLTTPLGVTGTTAAAASASRRRVLAPTAPAAMPAIRTTAVLPASHPGPRPACDGVADQPADPMEQRAAGGREDERAGVGAQFLEVGKRLRISIRIAAQADREIVAAVLALDPDAVATATRPRGGRTAASRRASAGG